MSVYWQQQSRLATQRADAFAAQAFATAVIFWPSLTLTVVGMLVATAQFIIGALQKKDYATKISIGKDGVSLDATALGIVIFALTEILFFLYIKFVYPRHLIGS